MDEFDVGDLVTIRAEFRDDDDALFDPATVTAQYQAPGGSVIPKVFGTDAEVLKIETGVYEMSIDADTAGKWFYRWVSTGTGQAAEFDVFLVGQPVTSW